MFAAPAVRNFEPEFHRPGAGRSKSDWEVC